MWQKAKIIKAGGKPELNGSLVWIESERPKVRQLGVGGHLTRKAPCYKTNIIVLAMEPGYLDRHNYICQDQVELLGGEENLKEVVELISEKDWIDEATKKS